MMLFAVELFVASFPIFFPFFGTYLILPIFYYLFRLMLPVEIPWRRFALYLWRVISSFRKLLTFVTDCTLVLLCFCNAEKIKGRSFYYNLREQIIVLAQESRLES